MSKNNKKKSENKAKKILITLVAIVLAVLCIGLALVGSLAGKGTMLRMKSAANSENYKISGTAMAYEIANYIQQNVSTLSQYGIDVSTGEYSQTIVDSSKDNAKSSFEQILALCEYAKANGITLDSKEKKEIKDSIKLQDEQFQMMSGVSYDYYLGVSSGNGVNSKDVRALFELQTLAQKATDAFKENNKPTVDEENAYRAENPTELEGVDFYAYSVSVAAEEETSETAETSAEEAISEYEGAITGENEAVSNADKIVFMTTLSGAKNVDEFKSYVRDYEKSLNPEADDKELDKKVENTFNKHILASAISNEEMQTWLFTAKEGEAKLFVDVENGTYTVAVLAKAKYIDESKTRNTRHILIDFDEENPDDNSAAQAILDELKAAGFSEEKWNELASAKSTDEGSNANGGLYENVPNGGFVKEYNDWLFDEDRKAGDSDIVKTSYGWHVVYYEGESDKEVWMNTADNAILNTKYEDMLASYKVEFDDTVIEKIDTTSAVAFALQNK